MANQHPAQSKPDQQDQNAPEGEKSPWEWVLAAVGAALILGAVGFLVYEGISHQEPTPRLTATISEIRPNHAGFVVEFTARNTADGTASGAVFEGTLRDGPRVVEKAQTTLQYVPSKAERKAALIFSHDPDRYRLDIRPKGYQRP